MSTENQCAICLEPFQPKDLVELPCAHYACIWCLKSLFQAATVSEENYPATCCSPIPLPLARPHLSFTIARRYEALVTEYETTDRTYCSNTDCKAFIKPDSIFGNKAICRFCKVVTCTECKEAAHGWKTCGEHAADLEAELARLEAELNAAPEHVDENTGELGEGSKGLDENAEDLGPILEELNLNSEEIDS
jgi:hypothetical protein